MRIDRSCGSHGPQAEAAIEAATRFCALVSADAWADLEDLAAADLVFRHADGRVETRAQWLAAMQVRHRTLIARELRAVSLGDVVVVQGKHDQVRSNADGSEDLFPLDVVQTWVHRDGSWLLATHLHHLAWPGRVRLDGYFRHAVAGASRDATSADVDAFAALLADEVEYRTADERRLSKQEWLAELREHPEHVRLSETTSMRLGESMIVTGRLNRRRRERAGQVMALDMEAYQAWTRALGGWRLRLHVEWLGWPIHL